MGKIIQYQPSVSPNAAIASPASVGGGIARMGENIHEGLMYGLHGVNQALQQSQIVKENTYHATAEQVAGDIMGRVEKGLDDEFTTRHKEKRWAGFEESTAPMINDAYSDESIQAALDKKFPDGPSPRLLPLVRDKLGFSQKGYFEKARLMSAKLNLVADDERTRAAGEQFQARMQTAPVHELDSVLGEYEAELNRRVQNRTLDIEKVQPMMSDAILSGINARFALDQEAGSLTAYEDNKKLIMRWAPRAGFTNSKALYAGLKGDKKAFLEAQEERLKDMLATSKGAIPPEAADAWGAASGLGVAKVNELITAQNHASLEARKKADEHAEHAKKKVSAQTLDSFTLELLDAYAGEEKARGPRLELLKAKFNTSKDLMRMEDREHFMEQMDKAAERAANVVTDPVAYGRVLEDAALHMHDPKLFGRITSNPLINIQDKKKAMEHVMTMRSKFTDEVERHQHELALKTYELKSSMFEEIPGPIASASQVQIMSVLSQVILEGKDSEYPYIREQWVKYKRNPSEFMDGLMVEQLKVAKKLALQQGKQIYDGLRLKPDSPAMTREIIKREFDTQFDSGKNAASALQLYMDTLYPTAQQQSAYDDKEAKDIKERSKQFERKK